MQVATKQPEVSRLDRIEINPRVMLGETRHPWHADIRAALAYAAAAVAQENTPEVREPRTTSKT